MSNRRSRNFPGPPSSTRPTPRVRPVSVREEVFEMDDVGVGAVMGTLLLAVLTAGATTASPTAAADRGQAVPQAAPVELPADLECAPDGAANVTFTIRSPFATFASRRSRSGTTSTLRYPRSGPGPGTGRGGVRLSRARVQRHRARHHGGGGMANHAYRAYVSFGRGKGCGSRRVESGQPLSETGYAPPGFRTRNRYRPTSLLESRVMAAPTPEHATVPVEMVDRPGPPPMPC